MRDPLKPKTKNEIIDLLIAVIIAVLMVIAIDYIFSLI
jgi:hypothetical protein